ncbi:MAG: DUF11 domain-containing protein [Bradymonadales bacterium]|nr:DUF11 domain-containing protein [Bradymonadales bacterium]
MNQVFQPTCRSTLLAAVTISLAFGLPSWPAFAQEHILRFETTTEGAITITGNTLGLSHYHDGTTSQNGQGVTDAIGTFLAAEPASLDSSPAPTTAPPWPAGTTSSWQGNGSSAVLDLPADKAFEVLYAELLWGGSWAYASEDVSAHLSAPVTLRFEGGESISVNSDPATAIKLDTPATGFYANYYVRSAEVTSFIQACGPGEYTVSGVPATQDHANRSTNAAGWTLVVAYQASYLPARNMALWIGAQWVDEGATVDFSVEGFCTPPTGPVTGQALISAIEGDANRPGNSALIRTSGDQYLALSAPNNPSDNFFCSQINNSTGVLDTLGTFGDRNHNPATRTNVTGGRQGWDITGVLLSGAHLTNNQTSATLRATSTGGAADDSYVVTVVAMTVDVNAPAFDLGTDAFTVTPDQARPGDTVTFTASLTNDGTAVARSVRFHLPLPEGLALTSFSIDGEPGDVDGNTVSTAQLTSPGVEIGDIAPGETVVLVLQVEVLAAPAPPAEGLFTTQGRISYEYQSCAGDPAIVTEIASDVDLAIRVPRLETMLSSLPSTLTREANATWRVRVNNTGTAADGPVTLLIGLPVGVTYLAGSTRLNGSSVADVSGQMPFSSASAIAGPSGPASTIAAGETATIELVVSVDSDAPDQLTFQASVDPDGSGPRPAVPASLVLNVSGSGTPDPYCGDGNIDEGEECDDGSDYDGDGCSSSCTIEPGWICTEEPSICVLEQVEVAESEPDVVEEPQHTEEPDLEPDTEDDADAGGATVTGAEACSCSAVGSPPGWALLFALTALVLRRRGRR